MTYCLNPDCQKPRNPNSAKVCRSCGAKLILKDRYRAIAAIGQGGFGRTFLAVDEDKPSKPRCVIKQFLPVAQTPQNLKKAASLFAQEAVRLEELGHHPQIPELLAHFNQDGHQYLIQEFIHGKNLADVLAEQGPFMEPQIREVLASLLAVLDFVHSHKVIHRDIKPGNIISTTGNRIGMGFAQPGHPNWEGLQQAIALETTQGCRNFVTPSYRFSELLSFSLSQPAKDLVSLVSRDSFNALLNRCQQLAIQFARYPGMPLAQRQYLVADASRLLYEIGQALDAKSRTRSMGQLVLVDFGAAKSLKGVAPMKTGTTIGSPEYVAPEQARGKAVFSSDLYSLGVTCIHLLTNVSPYDLFDPEKDAWVWRNYLPHPVSDKLGRTLDRLLEAAIARRYQSASEALQDLDGTALAPLQPVALQSLSTPSPSPQPPLPLQFPSPASSPSPIPTFQPSFRIAPRLQPRSPASTNGSYSPASTPELTEQWEEQESTRKSKRRSQPTWQCIHTFDSPGRVYAIALSPTEPILATSSGNTIKLWDLENLKLIRTLTGHLDIIPSLLISPDGKLLISGSADKTITIWELPTGKRLSNLALHADTVLALASSATGQILASSSFYDPIMLWNLSRGEKLNGLCGHSARIDTLAFHLDSETLASGSGDATIKLWNVHNGEELRTLEGHTHQIAALAFSPDGKTLASGSWDGTVKFWNLRSYRQGRTLAVESGRVNGLTFSSDGKRLAIASNTLQLWNPQTGKQLDLLNGHADAVSAITFGHDDQTLISASVDRTIKIWRYE